MFLCCLLSVLCVLFCSLFILTYISTWFCICHSFIVFIALVSGREFGVISPHARFQFELPRRKNISDSFAYVIYIPCNLQRSPLFFSTNALFATSRMTFDIKFFSIVFSKNIDRWRLYCTFFWPDNLALLSQGGLALSRWKNCKTSNIW